MGTFLPELCKWRRRFRSISVRARETDSVGSENAFIMTENPSCVLIARYIIGVSLMGVINSTKEKPWGQKNPGILSPYNRTFPENKQSFFGLKSIIICAYMAKHPVSSGRAIVNIWNFRTKCAQKGTSRVAEGLRFLFWPRIYRGGYEPTRGFYSKKFQAVRKIQHLCNNSLLLRHFALRKIYSIFLQI